MSRQEQYDIVNDWMAGFGCWSEDIYIDRLLDALATATGTAKTPKAVECEASQSGPKGNAQ